MAIRVLFMADSHLGLDLPTTTRVERRRRGHDFLANHAAALAPALAGEVDVVVHGGDVFDRPDVLPSLAYQAYQPLRRVADAGVPVFIVPGNHERSRLPHTHLLAHAGIRVFDAPRTFTLDVRGVRLALSGFPYERRDVRTRFRTLLQETGWRGVAADVRVLCVHHCIEGARVGPQDFTFTSARDVIRTADLPPEFCATLSGHIHRHQVLERDLRGGALPHPVLYPGSIERTATAEIGEPKGHLMLQLASGAVRWEFRELPARPMIALTLHADESLERRLRACIAQAPPDAVLHIRVEGTPDERQRALLSPASIRRLAPATMNVDVRVPEWRRRDPTAPSWAGDDRLTPAFNGGSGPG